MANNEEFNGSRQTPAQSGNGIFELDGAAGEESSGILRSYLALVALRHRRLLIAATVSSMVLVFCLTKFVMNPKYLSTAIIRPIGQSTSGIGGLLQSTGLSNMANMSGTGIDSDIGTNVHDPEELVAILKSYTFTSNLIESEKLGPRLGGGHSIWSLVPAFLRPKGGGGSPLWDYYQTVSSRFDCENSMRTGNITLTYIDKDPELANYVLRLYIDHLRDQLRAHDVAYDKAAARSLQQQAATVSDPMLRDDLYDLAARQIKKIGTAQANADFAFTVLERPYTPPYPDRPWVVLDTLAAGIVVPLFVFLGLVVRDWAPRVKHDLAEAAYVSERTPDSIALSRRPRRAPSPEQDRPYTG
ncbi:MAG TPA: hypothetical protein VKV05_09420 [Terriglobales bacterium]|jgi:hypothetical protein|nr:hypothetical protein [Terriglobales bacterium]